MTPGGVVNVLAAGAIVASATAALSRPGVERAAVAAAASAAVTTQARDERAVAPGTPATASTAAVASDRLDRDALEPVVADARASRAHDLVGWLAFEVHPATALLDADQLAELAPWLRADDLERLLELARSDPLEARRRAAFVALGHVRPASAAHVEALVAAFSARPSEESRLGLLEALLTLRHAGAPADEALELALETGLEDAPLIPTRGDHP